MGFAYLSVGDAAFATTLTDPPDLDAYYTFGIDLLLSAVESTAPTG